MQDVARIFDRYQAIRHRLPQVSTNSTMTDISSLLDIAGTVDAFVLDAFGVLNVGDTPIPGAAARVQDLRQSGHAIRVLSNAASYPHHGATAKLRKLGMDIDDREVITSRDAALRHLHPGLWGCIAAPSDDLSDIPVPCLRLQDDEADYDRVDGFLFLSTEMWTLDQQAKLERSLLRQPRALIVANADLVAPRGGRFSLEPGHFGHLLADRGVRGVRFFGKPFPDVFDLVERSLPNVPPDRIAMCGDTLHTDILGAAARGWQTVLVAQDGIFAGIDTEPYCRRSGLIPTWRVQRI